MRSTAPQGSTSYAKNVVKDILAIAHGAGHPGFAKCYEMIQKSFYNRSLTRKLRAYIQHCPECLILQTQRHAP